MSGLTFFFLYFKLKKQDLLAAEESNEFDYSNLGEAKSHIATKGSFDEIFGLFASFTPSWLIGMNLKLTLSFSKMAFKLSISAFFPCLLSPC